MTTVRNYFSYGEPLWNITRRMPHSLICSLLQVVLHSSDSDNNTVNNDVNDYDDTMMAMRKIMMTMMTIVIIIIKPIIIIIIIIITMMIWVLCGLCRNPEFTITITMMMMTEHILSRVYNCSKHKKAVNPGPKSYFYLG